MLSAVWEFLTNLKYFTFQVLNIILFPVSIAASFVTLSWNTSQSLARDYILQVGSHLTLSSENRELVDKRTARVLI